MYDMYPDAWTVVADRQHQVHADQPRRRARKEHSVVPAILQARAHKAGDAELRLFPRDPRPRCSRRRSAGGADETNREQS